MGCEKPPINQPSFLKHDEPFLLWRQSDHAHANATPWERFGSVCGKTRLIDWLRIILLLGILFSFRIFHAIVNIYKYPTVLLTIFAASFSTLAASVGTEVCNGTTAGLDYLKVSVDCQCKSPLWLVVSDSVSALSTPIVGNGTIPCWLYPQNSNVNTAPNKQAASPHHYATLKGTVAWDGFLS